MKVQLFSLATLATLALSSTAFAGTVSNSSGTFIQQGQTNTAIGVKNAIQGGPQGAVSATTQTGTGTGGSVASVTNNAATAIIQSQQNTAMGTKNVTQGGLQGAASSTIQKGDAKGGATAAVSVKNDALTSIEQYQQNVAIDSKKITQGGATGVLSITTQTGTAINDPAPVVKHPVYMPKDYYYGHKKPSHGAPSCGTGHCY